MSQPVASQSNTSLERLDVIEATLTASAPLAGVRAKQTTLVAGTKAVADATATANTRVVCGPFGAPVPGAGNLTVFYAHLSNSAGVGYTVQACLSDGTINVLDTSTLDLIAIG